MAHPTSQGDLGDVMKYIAFLYTIPTPYTILAIGYD